MSICIEARAGLSGSSQLGDFEKLALSREVVLRLWSDRPLRLRASVLTQFDGRRWTVTPARARADLLAVTGTTETCHAVGAGGVAMSFARGRWSVGDSGTDAGLRAICTNATGQVIAAGDRGTVLARMGH